MFTLVLMTNLYDLTYQKIGMYLNFLGVQQKKTLQESLLGCT